MLSNMEHRCNFPVTPVVGKIPTTTVQMMAPLMCAHAMRATTCTTAFRSQTHIIGEKDVW